MQTVVSVVTEHVWRQATFGGLLGEDAAFLGASGRLRVGLAWCGRQHQYLESLYFRLEYINLKGAFKLS